MNLYQFPITQYPDWNVVMTTMPSEEPVSNFGMGLTAYVIGDLLPKRKGNESVRETIEKIVQIPIASKLYIRSTWRQMQSQRGRLDLFEHWQITLELAEKYNKRVGFRIMLANPDIEEESLPDFVLEHVPMQYLGKGWDVEEGEYNLALWLPDEAESLQSNPLYTVQFANPDVWDESTGYNILGQVRVNSSVTGNTSSTDSLQVEELLINVK